MSTAKTKSMSTAKNKSMISAIGSYHLHGAARGTAPPVVIVAAGIFWALNMVHATYQQGGSMVAAPPPARVLAVLGHASAHWNGRSRLLNRGSDLESEEIVTTSAHSSALVKLADGNEFEIFPESQVIFRRSRLGWPFPVDRWINGIRARIERLGGTQPSNRISYPTAAMAVRAAIIATGQAVPDAAINSLLRKPQAS